MTREHRAKACFRLICICLAFAAVGLPDHLAGIFFDRTLLPQPSIAYTSVGIIVLLFNFVMSPFLVVARFMRDEYAEQLWQRRDSR